MGRRFEKKVTTNGTVTTDGDVEQPIQWSSEMHDTETALIYYKTADGCIGIDYSSCTGGIRPNLNASVSIELGLVMQISDKKEKYIGAIIQGGAGLTFTPDIVRF